MLHARQTAQISSVKSYQTNSDRLAKSLHNHHTAITIAEKTASKNIDD